jgi:hypothetical protein
MPVYFPEDIVELVDRSIPYRCRRIQRVNTVERKGQGEAANSFLLEGFPWGTRHKEKDFVLIREGPVCLIHRGASPAKIEALMLGDERLKFWWKYAAGDRVYPNRYVGLAEACAALSEGEADMITDHGGRVSFTEVSLFKIADCFQRYRLHVHAISLTYWGSRLKRATS